MSEGNIELVRRWFREFNEHGNPPLDICDPEIEVINPPQFPVRGTFRGLDGIRQWREEAFDIIDELRFELEDVFEAGDGETLVTFQRMCGVASHTRIPIDEPWASVWTIRNGKVVHVQGYVSRREAKKAGGVAE